jgi:hypothetical protein
MDLANNRQRDSFGGHRTEIDTYRTANPGLEFIRRRAQFLGKSVAPSHRAEQSDVCRGARLREFP